MREHLGNYADLRARRDLLGGEILAVEDLRVASDELREVHHIVNADDGEGTV